MYIPSDPEFCAGYKYSANVPGEDGYGRTKLIRFGWSQGNNPDRLTILLGGFEEGKCSTDDLVISEIGAELPHGHDLKLVDGDKGIIPRDTWVFMQIHIHHSFESTEGWLEMWKNSTYLGRAVEVYPTNVGTTNFRTVGESGGSGDFDLSDLTVGDYWNGRAYKDSVWYMDEFVLYNTQGFPPETLDAGGRPFIDPRHSVADFIP